MWALLMDGQQQGIGQNSDCCICTKVTGTRAGSGRELGKILCKPTNTSEGKYGAILAAEGSSDVPREMYYCSGFQDRWRIIPSLDLVIVRMGL
jgi:hypothetical protein